MRKDYKSISKMDHFPYYIKRLRELPPSLAIKKLALKPLRGLAIKLDKLASRLLVTYISDVKLPRNLEGIKSIKDFLLAIKGRRPSFFINHMNEQELISLIQKEYPKIKANTITEADKICCHIFDLLGSGPVNLDEFAEQHGGRAVCGYLPWHFDFKVGYRWNPKKYYKEIRPAYGKADIKVPWELSRFHHAALLGQAYWLTGDRKYALEFVRQVDDWIDRNPPKFGVNWACTMDVAIRAANWVLGFYFFKDSKVFTDEFLIKFLKSLLIHGRHIMFNLENKGITTNHYLSDLVGLIYLGVAFPEFKEARKWREFGIKELVNEMNKQVYDDGMDFEASTCYHRLALELFFYPAVLCQLNGIELPQTFLDKLKKMFDFVLYVLKPNGRMPQIGDNDNSRLHVLGKREILDMTYLLTYAALYFNDPTYKIEDFGFATEALWLFGSDAYEQWRKLPGRSVEELESRAFPNGGIYVMRHKKDYMVISCGSNGQGGRGGHAHNDKLSFELCVDGEDIIVDPGTYVYTANPEWRNKFRCTVYHNTVMVGNEEQNLLKETELFSLPLGAAVNVHEFLCTPERDLLEAELIGYQHLLPPVMHRRTVKYEKIQRKWSFTDTIQAERQRSITVPYHLAPKLAPRIVMPNCFLVTNEKGRSVRFLLHLSSGKETDMVTIESWISPSYGYKCKAAVVQHRVLCAFPLELSV